MSSSALIGTRVIESSAFIAAPLCGLLLSQFGADVIRIDNIGGGIDYNRMPRSERGRSFYWTSLNKNKRSVALNLRKPEGRELVRKLVSAPHPGGGILLTNVAAAWLSHSNLALDRPDLISCTIEGNCDGTTAVDYTVQSATGYPLLTGNGGLNPINNPFPAWDVICAHQAAAAMTANILGRQYTREGAEIRIALSDVAFSTISHLGLITEAQFAGAERPATGNYIFGAFGRDFQTADLRRVMIAAISTKQWAGLVQACEIEDALATLQHRYQANFDREEDRYEHREVIAALVEKWCAIRSLQEIAAIFDKMGVCWGVYQTVRELVSGDSRVSAQNAIFETIDTPGIGPHLAAGPAFRITGEKRSDLKVAPLLGESSEAVLGEILGLGHAQFVGLTEREIVAGPSRDPYFGH